jgi:hypothetical protein
MKPKALHHSSDSAGKWGRRDFLRASLAASFAGSIFSRTAIARPAAAGQVKHWIHIRLSGGFRFSAAFNGDVGDEFNPFGLARGIPGGVEWGPSALLSETGEWLTDELRNLGMRSALEVTNEIAVLTCVDHEPLAGSADGNHQTGLERFLTGTVGGETGIMTMLNFGRRAQVEAATQEGIVLLPAIIMGESGMGRGSGEYAAYRPPILRGSDMSRFAGAGAESIPAWARTLSNDNDGALRDAQNMRHFSTVDAFMQSRAATRAYNEIFNSAALAIDNRSNELIDGISNRELALLFGDSGAARNLRLALRLFHFGSPAVYLDQGGYDYHSDEDERLPVEMAGLNQLLAALPVALKKMQHPDGGSYWDHTVITMGSEFSRSANGRKFNSARGSDHGGDYATRWMSMPVMGGPISVAGKRLGETDRSTLAAKGKVYSYRSLMRTMFDALGVDDPSFFPADPPFADLWR